MSIIMNVFRMIIIFLIIYAVFKGLKSLFKISVIMFVIFNHQYLVLFNDDGTDSQIDYTAITWDTHIRWLILHSIFLRNLLAFVIGMTTKSR